MIVDLVLNFLFNVQMDIFHKVFGFYIGYFSVLFFKVNGFRTFHY